MHFEHHQLPQEQAETEISSNFGLDVDMQSRSSDAGLSSDVSYLEKSSESERSQCSSPSQSENSELSETTSMQTDWIDKLQNNHPKAFEQLLVDDESKLSVNSDEDDSSSAEFDEKNRMFGWTEEDNQRLYGLINEVFTENGEETGKVSWRQLTERFNKKYNQKRTRIQLYSHYRYATTINRKPCYLKAEEELILAFDEIGIPASSMLPFLVNDRSEKVIVAKIQKLKASNQAKASEGSKQVAFRKRIHETVLKNGGIEAFKRNEVPKKVIDEVRYLIKSNPNLQNKYLNLKPAGRPAKRIKMIPVMEQLRTLFRPFSYINNRRRRTTSMPGDGRRYGLNLFCLNRLLGSPFELSKMPASEEEAIEAGVEKSDYLLYANLRELMVAQEQKASSKHGQLPEYPHTLTNVNSGIEDRKNYFSNPGGPPPESLLPPTLFTLAGLRGLMCYKENLKATLAEEENQNLPDPSTIGNKEADEKLERFLMSMFQWSWHLVNFEGNASINSDGDSDTDEDICFVRQPTADRATSQQTLDQQVIEIDRDLDEHSVISESATLESRA